MALLTYAQGVSMTEEFKSAKEVARRLGTDARTLRKFLRSSDSPFESVGQGGRYNFDEEDVALLQEAFNGYLRKKKTAQKPKTIVVDETPAEGLSDTDFDLDFGELEELPDDIEE
jgi:MerR HTH family regulatory protein